MLWALDEPRPDGLLVVASAYFETDGVPFTEYETYVDHEEPPAAPDIVHFNHGLGEILRSRRSRSTTRCPGLRSVTR
jgi:hypothetical protein